MCTYKRPRVRAHVERHVRLLPVHTGTLFDSTHGDVLNGHTAPVILRETLEGTSCEIHPFLQVLSNDLHVSGYSTRISPDVALLKLR